MAHQPLGGNPAPSVNPNSGHPGPLLDADVKNPHLNGTDPANVWPQIADIASANGKTPAQVLLSWAVQRGTSVVPKTVKEQRMMENIDLFKLTNEQMTRISGLAEQKSTVRFLDPREYLGFNIFDEDADQPVGDS